MALRCAGTVAERFLTTFGMTGSSDATQGAKFRLRRCRLFSTALISSFFSHGFDNIASTPMS